MSFILDGLKKSEQERADGELPGLHTVHGSGSIPTRRRSPLWARVLVMTLLLNVAVLVWLLGPWAPGRGDRTTVLHKKSVAVPSGKPVPMGGGQVAVVGKTVSTSDHMPSATRAATKAKATSSGIKGEVSSAGEKEGRRVAPVQVASRPSHTHPKPSSAKRPTAGAESVAPQPPASKPARRPVYTLKELPSAIRDEIPPLTLSLHYYTTAPASRLVRLNGQLLREGDSLNAEIKVAAITPSGVILSCQGIRFRLSNPKAGDE